MSTLETLGADYNDSLWHRIGYTAYPMHIHHDIYVAVKSREQIESLYPPFVLLHVPTWRSAWREYRSCQDCCTVTIHITYQSFPEHGILTQGDSAHV